MLSESHFDCHPQLAAGSMFHGSLRNLSASWISLARSWVSEHDREQSMLAMLSISYLWTSPPARVLQYRHETLGWLPAMVAAATMLALTLLACYVLRWMKVRGRVYLVDYTCVKYGEEHKANLEVLQYFLQSEEKLTEESGIKFQLKVLLKSGVGEEAYVPRANLERGRFLRMEDSRVQSEVLVVGAVDALLKKTGVPAEAIDMLVVNCGLFNPTPSLASVLVNRFKMRPDVKSFHLGGMGCSAGLIAVDLARDLLRVHRGCKYAVVASSEVLQEFYEGKERAMMVTNCLFRAAGCALLLSSRRTARAKMELLHCVRVNTAARDEAHECVVVKEDADGLVGAELSEKLIEVAGQALTANIQRLAPQVLPLGELIRAGCYEAKKKLAKHKHGPSSPQYVPDFKLAFEHFCIHPGSRAVIEGIGKSLRLSKHDLEPSLMALHRFGNTSCAGVWYIMAYCEAQRRLRRGDRVWQIGLGSGFKCTTAVWRVLRDLRTTSTRLDQLCNPWHDCIHRYPVPLDVTLNPHVQSFVEFLRNKTFKGRF